MNCGDPITIVTSFVHYAHVDNVYAETLRVVGCSNLIDGQTHYVIRADEGVKWVRGHVGVNSLEVAAARAAQALIEPTQVLP